MLLSIACILAAFLWLLWETNDLSVNLCGKVKPKTLLLSAGPIILALPAPKVQFDAIERPYSWKTAEQKKKCLMLCHSNYHCAYKSKCKKTERWTSWKLPARTIKAWGFTFNFSEQCNIYRALLLGDVASAQKPRVKHTITAPGTGYTVSLFADWINKHDFTEANEYEATIDITCGENTISINGNYKTGMIKEFVKANRA